jgi:hypothetical protein
VRLIAVRFGFLYFVLFGLPGPLVGLPIVGRVATFYADLWGRLVVWFGESVLRLDVPPPVQNGSGDQLVSYVELVVLVLVAGLGTLVWSLLDRGRREHRALAEALRVYLRYLLAVTMFLYGLGKVLKAQFPMPSSGRLLVPIGQTSPMGLLWTFMGYSTPYTMLAGLAEVIGGALLLFRRTTLLGALLLAGVLGNIVAMNFAYDVPVKIYSFHLLLMVAILLARDARRLVDLLVRNRPTPAAELGSPPLAGRWPRGVRVAKVVVVIAMIASALNFVWPAYTSRGDGRVVGPLEGAYRVVAMERDGAATAPADPAGWRQLGIGPSSLLTVSGDGAITRYSGAVDQARGTLRLTDRADPSRTAELTAVREGDQLRVAGVVGGVRVTARLRAMEEEEFLLLHRGFHWVSPEPFNR